jgi:integrase
MTDSKYIVKYINSKSDRNKRTGYEYLRRLEYFEKFLKEKYKMEIDELVLNGNGNGNGSINNIYDILSSYVSYLVNNEANSRISNLTISQRLTTARTFLEYCDFEISPRKFKLKVTIPRVVRKYKEALTKEDIIRILEACSDSTKLKTYILFLAATGSRASEGCSICLGDLDLDNHRASIRGEFTKTGVERYMFLTGELCQQLKQWLDFKYRVRRTYSKEQHKNIYVAPERKNTDLVFASLFNNHSDDKKEKRDEHKIVLRLYVTLAVEFDKILDGLGIGFEDSTKRRRRITLHSFRRWTKSVITDLGYSDYSEWFIGHAGSTYYRKSDREKFQLFKRLEQSLTYLDQTALEKKHADIQNRIEIMEHENLSLQKKIHEHERERDLMVQLMDRVTALEKGKEKERQSKK